MSLNANKPLLYLEFQQRLSVTEEDFQLCRAGANKYSFSLRYSMIRKIIYSAVFLALISTGVTYSQFGQNKKIVTIQLIKSQDKVHPNSLLKVAVKAKVDEGWHINSNKPNEDFLIGTTVASLNQKFPLAKVVFPNPKEITLGFSDKPVSVFEGEFTIGLLVNVDKALPVGNYKIPIQLDYQSCNNQSCMPPTSVKDSIEVSVVDSSTAVGEINQSEFQNIDLSKSPVVKESNENSIASLLDKSGLLIGLLAVFLGGLALNLTPCVYPLIPITIGYFGGQAEGRTSRLFLLGILYVLGMALTYSVIGVVNSLSGAVFGTLLQNPFVIIGVFYPPKTDQPPLL